MKNKKYKSESTMGFTLVELVVVATILAILSAVGFSGYIGYIGGARDSNRLAQLENIRSGLQSYAIKGNLPLPSDYVTVNDGTTTLGYQGYAGESILDTIGLQKGGKDPQDDTFYTYYLSKNRSNFQLLGFLEEENNETAYNTVLTQSYADYADRFPTVTGESLGVLLGTGVDANIPIQEIETIKTATSLDIGSTSSEYQAVIKDDNIVTGDSDDLGILASLAKTGGFLGKSCKDTIDANAGLLGQDGTYSVKPQDDIIEIYCDMTTDGGGWTQIKTTAGGWMSDENKLLMPDAVELMFDYNSNVTGTLVDHQYKISKFLTVNDVYQEINSSTHMINIILGKSPDTGITRNYHTGDQYEFTGKNVGTNYDECHGDENVSYSNYSMYSYLFAKNRFQLHGGGTNKIWGGGGYSNMNVFQTSYCVGGPSGSNISSYTGDRTDIYIR